MDSIARLHQLGQSLWYDNIQRKLIESGELEKLITRGDIRGVTSNPSIFNNAIAKSNDYENALKPLAWSGMKAEDIFWQLAIEDIQAAADLFIPVYEATRHLDGFVSLEVSPLIANNTKATVEAAKNIWQRVNRPNLMVKIPATEAGIPAIRQAIATGINVNVTLIFSLDRYALVMDAYLAGLEDRVKNNLPIDNISSVASFFISRVDSKVDALLSSKIDPAPEFQDEIKNLLGKAAIANARMAYDLFKQTFTSKRFSKLRENNANKQRPLWASTSTKNPDYRDVLYIEELIGDETVNTAPPATIDSFRDHGNAATTIGNDMENAKRIPSSLEKFGISMQKVTLELEDEGVKAFADAFNSLIGSIEMRRKTALKEINPILPSIPQIFTRIKNEKIIEKIFDRDPSLWVNEVNGQLEIKKRLGWLDAPSEAVKLIPNYQDLLEVCLSKGYKRALILGMGGSSLAPEVFSEVFGNERDPNRTLDLSILDSTNPDQVSRISKEFLPEDTLYIVSSKSGSTTEVNAFFQYFWSITKEKCGDKAGDHFTAITDPGTSLDQMARDHHFLNVTHGNPEIGGRFSALSPFGLLPGVLCGMDARRLVHRAEIMRQQCLPGIIPERNPGLMLGGILGYWAEHGKDKLTILADPEISSFGSWLEQLVAESTGKVGKGILPIDQEPLIDPKALSKDRLFIYFRLTGSLDDYLVELQAAGQPVITLPLNDVYDLGGEFYRWAIAVSVACSFLKINPFDQPDVQYNKSLTQKMIEEYKRTNGLLEDQPIWCSEKLKIYGTEWTDFNNRQNFNQLLWSYLSQSVEGDYIAINAYIPRNPENHGILNKLRKSILEKFGKATTLGFGPRFLHSTGQYHKGGPNNGVFIEITQEPSINLDIPMEGMTFDVLERAQALGDFKALMDRDRRVIRIHVAKDELDHLIKD